MVFFYRDQSNSKTLRARWLLRLLNPYFEQKALPLLFVSEALASNARATSVGSVSSFGLGGTNAHALLDRAADPSQHGAQRKSRTRDFASSLNRQLKEPLFPRNLNTGMFGLIIVVPAMIKLRGKSRKCHNNINTFRVDV